MSFLIAAIKSLLGQSSHWIPWFEDDWFLSLVSLEFITEIFFIDDDLIDVFVKGGFELSFYGGLKMHDLGGLRINRC